MGCTESKEAKKPTPAAAKPDTKEDTTKKEEPKKEEPKTEAKKEEPKKEEPKKEEPKKEAKKEEPKKEEAKKAEPAKVTHRMKVNLMMEKARIKGEISKGCIDAFMSQYDALVAGDTGLIPEADITAVDSVENLENLDATEMDEVAELLSRTVVLKLNGGLGTGMGLSKAKSLLEVRDGNNFLDFIVKQMQALRTTQKDTAFMLMNSFSTSGDTRTFFRGVEDFDVQYIMQNKVLKINQETFAAAENSNAELNWCPPGHGDVYAALMGEKDEESGKVGKLDELINAGKKYIFISNSDNLGATVDPAILRNLAEGSCDFIMEVCERTEADKKGGHLAKKGDSLILRESAQCPKEDEAEFQNVGKHKYFNTNNIWIKLAALKAKMEENDGFLKLPLIRNAKTVDPTDKNSEKVYQCETAMGAAIETFGDKAKAVCVSRTRFAPVKTCGDLLALRSDAYEEVNSTLQLVASRNGVPPTVVLGDTYKMIDAFEALVADGVPSMVECNKLVINGTNPIKFSAGTTFKGDVTINAGDGTETKTLPAGEYSGEVNL
eukprot:TRINITY_DN91_c0_g2_i1.p1 TRINITY_DN91_c0_g2~~TRINITY_DN91_c0_g2_i1.p1  ORF type:complete len:549 (+),score=252.37 TRINITY_DN91_c0_g2_i1:46-1692(+)